MRHDRSVRSHRAVRAVGLVVAGAFVTGAGASGCPQNQAGDTTLTTSSAASAGSSAPPPIPPPAATIAAPTASTSSRSGALATRPPGVDPATWQRIFDTYGRLLELDDRLDDYHRRYPDKTEVVTLGTTHEGRPVRALVLADHPAGARDRPSMLLNGGHHGDEPLASELVLDAVESILSRSDSDPRMKRYLAELSIWCVPLVNPDGFAAFMLDFGAGRKNGRETRAGNRRRPLSARGVDLNRNYPFRWGALNGRGGKADPDDRFYKGPEAGSEPEVRAMVGLSDREHFVASISYHIGTVALLAPYTIEGVRNPSPNEAWLVAEELVQKMPRNPDRPLQVRKNLYPVDGTDQDYHRAAHGTLALLFEAASRSWETPLLQRRTLAAVRPLWGLLFDRYLDGPSVQGHVRDAQGRPVAAEVHVAEVENHAGEVWRSRCRDGFFGRFLPDFGRFTVKVTPAGGAAVEKIIEAAPGKGRAVVDIVVAAEGGTCPGETSR